MEKEMIVVGIMGLYSAGEINMVLKLISELISLILITSIGTFTREMIFPKENTFKQNIGLALMSGFVAFGINVFFQEMMTLAYTALICFASGFFVPVFKDWFKGKTFFKIFTRVLKNTSDATSTIIDEVDKELHKDDKEED